MDAPAPRNHNRLALAIFAPVLILAGALGFVLPPGPMSAAPAYNIFHLVFGALGGALVLLGRDRPIRAFNIGFGLIDLYQAAASLLGLFPIHHFQWKAADDVLHVVLGAALVAIGLSGRPPRPAP
jgi:hypothetical protein